MATLHEVSQFRHEHSSGHRSRINGVFVCGREAYSVARLAHHTIGMDRTGEVTKHVFISGFLYTQDEVLEDFNVDTEIIPFEVSLLHVMSYGIRITLFHPPTHYSSCRCAREEEWFSVDIMRTSC